jgi:hypothetical protein
MSNSFFLNLRSLLKNKCLVNEANVSLTYSTMNLFGNLETDLSDIF